MSWQKNTKFILLLFSVLGLVTLSGCPRKDPPPVIENCIGDGSGGADCVEIDGKKQYRPPSELINYWMTNQPDLAKYAAWATGADAEEVNQEILKVEAEARNP